MLFLVFKLGDDRYALPARSVIEVTPFLAQKRLPHAPKGIAGVFNYRGTPVPVVDLAELTLGRPSLPRLSTRMLIVKCPAPAHQTRLLGLVVEQATELLRKDPAAFAAAEVKIRIAPYLGPVFMDAKGPVQLIYEQHLLTEPVRERLFTATLPITAQSERARPPASSPTAS